MKLIVLCILTLSSVVVYAGDKKIDQQDALGNIQYHEPSISINSDGRIIQTDTLGNKQYHKQQFKIQDGKIYQTDPLGNIQYHKPQLEIK